MEASVLGNIVSSMRKQSNGCPVLVFSSFLFIISVASPEAGTTLKDSSFSPIPPRLPPYDIAPHYDTAVLL